MNDNLQHETEPLRHEPIDANVRAVWITGAALAAIVAATFVVIYVLQAWFETSRPSQETQAAVDAETQTDADWNVPPQVQQLRTKEQRFLTTYEWVDQTAGVARIPLDRALEMIADNGLPEAIGANVNPAMQNTTE